MQTKIQTRRPKNNDKTFWATLGKASDSFGVLLGIHAVISLGVTTTISLLLATPLTLRDYVVIAPNILILTMIIVIVVLAWAKNRRNADPSPELVVADPYKGQLVGQHISMTGLAWHIRPNMYLALACHAADDESSLYLWQYEILVKPNGGWRIDFNLEGMPEPLNELQVKIILVDTSWWRGFQQGLHLSAQSQSFPHLVALSEPLVNYQLLADLRLSYGDQGHRANHSDSSLAPSVGS